MKFRRRRGPRAIGSIMMPFADRAEFESFMHEHGDKLIVIGTMRRWEKSTRRAIKITVLCVFAQLFLIWLNSFDLLSLINVAMIVALYVTQTITLTHFVSARAALLAALEADPSANVSWYDAWIDA